MFKNTKLIGLFSLTACFFSAGIVAPVLSQPQEYPTQVSTQGGVTWELKSCARKPNTIVTCIFSFRSSGDGGYGISTDKGTKIVDAEGNEYYISKIQVGKRIAGLNDNFSFSVTQNADYLTTINFTGVPNSVSQITLLQVPVAGNWVIKFRDIPIINPDGSFTVIPHPNKPTDNTQPSNNSTSTTKPRICLPFIGCH